MIRGYNVVAKIVTGINDFATMHPELLDVWDYIKNSDICPEKVGCASKTKVWWKCSLGHSYETSIDLKSRGFGCPYCSNHRVLQGFNDFATTNEELLSEWDYRKNSVSPHDITGGSGEKVWWICAVCGHEWIAQVQRRTSGGGCPECSKKSRGKIKRKSAVIKVGAFSHTNPELLKEWDYDTNAAIGIVPDEVTAGTHQKVNWICGKCNSRWMASIASRARGTGCPKCGLDKAPVLRMRSIVNAKGSIFDVHPELKSEWDNQMNESEGISSELITAGSDQLVWWICDKGHSYKLRVCHKVNGIGCSICARERMTSFPEQCLFFYLKKIFSDTVNGARNLITPYELDIYIPTMKTAIEYDGQAWHKDNAKDLQKNKLCQEKGIRLFRVRESECPDIPLEGDVEIFRYVYGNIKELEDIIREIISRLSSADTDVDIERDSAEIYEQYVLIEKSKSIAVVKPELLLEWNSDRNGNLRPDRVSYGTRKKIWWICDRKHEWKASVSDRVRGNGCPFCSNKKLLQGFNDLQTTHPELAVEWNHKRNERQPSDYINGASDKVWWICSKGHEWCTTINSRVRTQAGCPKCGRRLVEPGFNDFATTHPELLSEWNYEKNSAQGLAPSEVMAGQRKRVWWICPMGHDYEANIIDRVRGCGCSVCAGKKVLAGINDLATLSPHILKEWSSRNSALPTEITAKSNKKVWWVCKEGHEWQASVADRTRIDGKASGCPVCCGKKVMKGYNDLATTDSDLLSEWNWDKNQTVQPTDFTRGSSKKVWWICKEGHEWEAVISSRSAGRGCPICGIAKMSTNRSANILANRGSFADNHPELLSEWNYEKNTVLPSQITGGSHEKVWWNCNTCGYEWLDTISHRISGRTCALCRKKIGMQKANKNKENLNK